jgi:uncharacterized membrane protein YccC
LKLAESQRLATVTVAILMLAGRGSATWIIGLHRFLEVSIGILVALLISVVLWPSGATGKLRKGIAAVLGSLEAMYQTVSRGYRTGTTVAIEELRSRLEDTLRGNQGLLRYAIYERVSAPQNHELLVLLMDHVDRIFDAVAALELATRGSAGDSYFQNFATELEQLETRISAAFEWLQTSVAAWRFDREWPDLGAAVGDLDEKAATSRKSGTSRSYELEEILRFYSFLLGSKNLVREVERARAVLGAGGAGG